MHIIGARDPDYARIHLDSLVDPRKRHTLRGSKGPSCMRSEVIRCMSTVLYETDTISDLLLNPSETSGPDYYSQ